MSRKNRAEALENPSVSVLVGAAGLSVVSGGAWFYYRSSQRQKLTELLTKSSMVQQATEKQLVFWTPEEKAADLIGYTNLTSADEAYGIVLAELHKLLPEDPNDMLNLTDDAKRIFEEKTGVNVDQIASSAYNLLPSWLKG